MWCTLLSTLVLAKNLMLMAAAIQRAQRLTAQRFHRKSAARPGGNAIVSFTFDDFPRSAWTAGGQILGEYGVRGTYYVSLGLMDKTTPVGEMFDRRDLEAVAEAGHELACHTHDHALCCNLNSERLLANCKRNQSLMSEMLGGYRLRNFSFPEGVVNASAKALLNSVYDSCRTIEPGINRDQVDLGFLRANRVYSTTPEHALREIIRRNHLSNGWLILYTHDIDVRPSQWGCTPEQFRAVAAWAVDSGAEILPIGDATKRFLYSSSVA
jgi:peptidoglycan/xylan/chitin deacetylase (PgdA/CDA1 family)